MESTSSFLGGELMSIDAKVPNVEGNVVEMVADTGKGKKKREPGVKAQIQQFMSWKSFAEKKADAELAAIESRKNDAETLHEEMEATADKAAASCAKIDTFRDTADAKVAQIDGIKEAAAQKGGEIDEIAERMTTRDAQLAKDQARLQAVIDNAEAVSKTVVDLLPSAASAGLAETYAEDQERLQRLVHGWTVGFVVGLVGLVVLAVLGREAIMTASEGGIAELAKFFLMKSPLSGPFIGLIWVSLRKMSLYGQMVEAYRHKKNVARALQGFKREMGDMPFRDGAVSPMERLAEHSLDAFGDKPSAAFHKQTKDTPFDELKDVFHDGLAQALAAAKKSDG